MSRRTSEFVEQFSDSIRSHPLTVGEKAAVLSMLSDYAADLREREKDAGMCYCQEGVTCPQCEREAAKNVVTDEVVNKAADAFNAFVAEHGSASATNPIRAALEAVWPVQAQQGEPMAWMVAYTRSRTGTSAREFYGSAVAAEIGAQALRDAMPPMIPTVTPLYTHAERPAVPEGWKLVPVEPTKEMLYRAQAVNGGNGQKMPKHSTLVKKWKAMLAAAPQPEGGES